MSVQARGQETLIQPEEVDCFEGRFYVFVDVCCDAVRLFFEILI